MVTITLFLKQHILSTYITSADLISCSKLNIFFRKNNVPFKLCDIILSNLSPKGEFLKNEPWCPFGLSVSLLAFLIWISLNLPKED